MHQTLVPVLLLAAVALSSSNILPMMSDRQDPNAINILPNDNILSNRYSKAVHNNIFYKMPQRTSHWTSESYRLMRKLAKYLNVNIDRAQGNFNDVITEDDNYDGEGFRKEQWHNYPRQLDRLHECLTQYLNGGKKRNTDRDDPGMEYYDSTESKQRNFGETSSKEYVDSQTGNNVYDSIVGATNPLLSLTVHLTCLNNHLKNTQSSEAESFQTQFKNEKETNDLAEKLFMNEINPATKVKREGVTSQDTENTDENTPGKKKTKRLFSLWSRLQSMSHKGHELPHRRHLAYYGFHPEGNGAGTLTAETRATFLRPPGSPLRWG